MWDVFLKPYNQGILLSIQAEYVWTRVILKVSSDA